MEEVKEQISQVNEENYDKLLKMILSNDEATRNVAFTIIDQCDFEKSKVYILCLIQQTFPRIYGTKGNFNDFAEQFPELYDRIYSMPEFNDGTSKISYKKIFDYVQSKPNNEKQIKFLMEVFKTEFIGIMRKYDFRFLDYLDITLTPKNLQDGNTQDKGENSSKV